MVVRRVADREPACIDEKRAVERARRRVGTAERKIEAVRRWTGVIDRAADDFRRARTQFATWLDVDLSRAAAALDQMSESLVTYISLEAPSDQLPPAAPRRGKGDRSNLPERPGGCFAQIGPVPFSPAEKAEKKDPEP